MLRKTPIIRLVKQIVLVQVNQKAMILEKDSKKNTAQMFQMSCSNFEPANNSVWEDGSFSCRVLSIQSTSPVQNAVGIPKPAVILNQFMKHGMAFSGAFYAVVFSSEAAY